MSIMHKIRTGDEGKTRIVTLTLRNAIKYFCLECMGWDKQEVELCTAPLCPLFPFRNSKATKGVVPRTQKQIEALKATGFQRRESS